MSFSDNIPALLNNIGSDIPKIAANTDFIKAAISNQHGWDDDDATKVIHLDLLNFESGLLANRPDTGTADQMYYATDGPSLWYGTGTGGVWNSLVITEQGNYANHGPFHTDGTDDIQTTSESQKGIVQLETVAETEGGVGTTKATTGAGVLASIQLNGSNILQNQVYS